MVDVINSKDRAKVGRMLSDHLSRLLTEHNITDPDHEKLLPMIDALPDVKAILTSKKRIEVVLDMPAMNGPDAIDYGYVAACLEDLARTYATIHHTKPVTTV